ncbi:MAG: 50S ribosomal protein L24 [Nanoarchaeota archaeon]
MKKDYSKHWKSSKNPRKQRKYIANAPLHIRRRFLSSLLSKELRKKYNRRSLPVRVDDQVTVLRGQFKKSKGKITSVDIKKLKLHLDSAQLTKKDGSKVFYPIHPSNVMITNLNLDDKERMKILERTKNVTSEKNKSS